jgi:excisionase family DNA binding protein
MIMEELIMDVIHTLQQKRLLRVDEAAQILNVSRWTVYRWVEAGRLGGTRLGAGSLRIFSETVAALIDLHCVGMTPVTPVERSVTPIPPKQRDLKHRYSDGERGRDRHPVAV